MEPWLLRVEVAKALRGDWPTPWDELPDDGKARWLARADRVLDALGGHMEKKSRVVDDWRWVLFKSHSMKLAAIASAVSGWAISNLDTIGAVVAMAPPEVRSFIPLPVMFLVFGTILVVRLWKQKK